MGEIPHVRLVAFLLTLAVSCALFLVPIYSGVMTSTDAGGHIHRTYVSTRFTEVNGVRGVIWLIALPVASAIPLFFKRAKTPVAAAILVFDLLAFTIGLFYLPSAILLFWPERFRETN